MPEKTKADPVLVVTVNCCNSFKCQKCHHLPKGKKVRGHVYRGTDRAWAERAFKNWKRGGYKPRIEEEASDA